LPTCLLWLNRKLGSEKKGLVCSPFLLLWVWMLKSIPLFYLYCMRRNTCKACTKLFFFCGAWDAEDESDRQLSPSLNDPDVLPVRPKRNKAAVPLLCRKRTVGNACKCFFSLSTILIINRCDSKQMKKSPRKTCLPKGD
jgi:hypothetical protein